MYAGNPFQSIPTTRTSKAQAQGMQVVPFNQYQPHGPGQTSSRYAGSPFQPVSTSKAKAQCMQVVPFNQYQPVMHELQCMQVIPFNQYQPHEPRTRGSRYAGNHFQPGHQPRTHEPRTQGSRHAGNHTNQQGTRTSQARTRDTRFKVCR